MPSYGFCFRASTRRGGGPGKLYLRVVHDGESRSVTTCYRIHPDEWDAAVRGLRIPYGRGSRVRQLVEIESAMLCDLRRMDSVIRILEDGGAYTVDELMCRYRAVMTGNTLGAFAYKLAAELERSGHRRTSKAYRTAVLRLQRFNGGVDPGFEQITAEFLAGFQQSLRDEGRTMNTISFYMRTLRSIYHKAIAEGRVARRAESLFAGVYTGVSPTRKLALTHNELAMLSAFDPTEAVRNTGCLKIPGHLERSLAMFLFCYHARGMCFVDMANLRKSDLSGDTIRYRRSKTGQYIEVKVLPAMRRIIEWFAPSTAGSVYLFPVITDPGKDHALQYESGLRLQNKRLKKIASMCGISKRLSTHFGRHAFGTLAVSKGMPIESVSKILGHTNITTTQIYAKITTEKLDRDISAFGERLEAGFARAATFVPMQIATSRKVSAVN